jgi:hypothetical protein
MFQNATDVAKGALRLIELAETPEIAQDKELASTLELAAAMMATHVRDWADADRDDFKTKYPSWDSIRLIANGTKHPFRGYPNISTAKTREPEWEDDDFMDTGPGTSQLFVEVEGRARGVRALTWGFCKQYLSPAKPERAGVAMRSGALAR